MSTIAGDTHPADMSAVHGRIKREQQRIDLLEAELHGGPGANGIKGDVAIVRRDVEVLLTKLPDLQASVEGAVRRFNAQQGPPSYFWVGICFVLGMAAMALLLFAFVFARSKGVL